VTDSPLPPEADDPIGGWSLEDAAAEIEEAPDAEAPAEPDPAPLPPRRERPKREPPPVERRLHPAGHALVIVVVGLAISLLLNAPGLHKTAQGQTVGWKRDVALAVTGPLDTLSGALLLDEPRAAVKSVLGRSDDDDIDTEIALPPEEPTGGTGSEQPTRTPVKRAFTKTRQMRLWVAGDSLVVVPGQSIVRAAGATPVVEPVGGVDGRVATGLERPDVFNWFRYIPERIRELKPDVVVLCFGGNDDHGYMTGLPKGVSIDGFASPSWRKEYARRVGGLMDAMTRAGVYVVWIGLPITKDEAQTQRYDAINAIVAAEARQRPKRTTYVDTYTTFASDTGGYTEYLSQTDGSVTKVRAQDGVHFERAGGDMIAREVLKRLNKAFDLTSWRKAKDGGGAA
jgi:hypothetical protein